MKQRKRNDKVYNKKFSKYSLDIKDQYLQEEYLLTLHKKFKKRTKIISFIALIWNLIQIAIYCSKDRYFISEQFIIISSFLSFIYILLCSLNYCKFQIFKKFQAILLLVLFILQGFYESYISQFYTNFMKDSAQLTNQEEDWQSFAYFSQLRGVSLCLAFMALSKCIITYKFRILLYLFFYVGLQIFGIYQIVGAYEKILQIISCIAIIFIISAFQYFEEKKQTQAFLDLKKGQIYKDTLDRMIPQNIITSLFNRSMGRLNFFSSNCEALKNYNISNEENFQLFLENCYIDKVEASPFFSSQEFDQTTKRIAGISTQINLKFICKEIIIRQDNQQQKFNLRKKSASNYQQNYDVSAFNTQKSGTFQYIPSQTAVNSPNLPITKNLRMKSISKKNSVKNPDLKQFSSKKLSNVYSNIQTKSGNELKSLGQLISNNEQNCFSCPNAPNQQFVQNNFNVKTFYSCFQGEIKQEDGISKRVNIRIWNYKLIDDFIVICIEDQSFKQQYNSLKDKNVVMQFFLSYYLVKQENLTRKSLAEQKFAYSHLKLPFYKLKQKTIIQQDQAQGTFAQQYKNVIIGQNNKSPENSDGGVSIFDSNEKFKNTKNQNKLEIYDSINLNTSYQNNQNQTCQYQCQNSHLKSYLNSPQNIPFSNNIINTELIGSQIGGTNDFLVGEDRKITLNFNKQHQKLKKSRSKRIESAETSIQLDPNYTNNQNDQENKFTVNQQKSSNFIEFPPNILSKKQCSQIKQSQGDYSALNSPLENEKQQIQDSEFIQVEELAEEKQEPKLRNLQKQSQSLSPKQSNNQFSLNLRLTPVNQQNNRNPATPSSKKSKRSFTYHHNLQSGNSLPLTKKLNQPHKRSGKQKLSLVRFLSNNYDKNQPVSDYEEDSQAKVSQANIQLFSIGSKHSINSQIVGTPNKFIKSEQQSPLVEKGTKPSIFLTLNKSPTSELEKNKQENTHEETNQGKISQFINALRHTQKCEFYLYQAQSLTQNYNILQSFLFQNRSFKYQLLNTQILDLIKGILHICQPLIEKKSLKVLIQDKNLENNTCKNLYQDKERLSLMLFNILFNTLSFCKNKSQISIYFQTRNDIQREEDNVQNSISIQDQLPSCQELYYDQQNMQQNTSIPKQYNRSQGNIMLTPNKQLLNQHNNNKEFQIGKRDSYSSSNNNTKDNTPLDPNQLKIIIINECDDIQSSLYKIEESNNLNSEQLLSKAIQIVQATNQIQTDNFSTQQQNPLNDTQKNPYQYVLKKRISQQFPHEIKQLNAQTEENRQKNLKPSINSSFNIREPAPSVYFNKLKSTQETLKIGIIVAKFILKKIGPYEKIVYSSHGSNQIKTELVIYKDLRLLEPEQPMKTRQTIYSYQQSQSSQQNIQIDQIKSKFYNSGNTNYNQQIKSISSKTFIQIPLAIQSNEENIEKINNDDENSLSKHMIDQKIKRKFGEQPIYFEDINERDKHNSSIVSEDYSKNSIPFERQISILQSINKTIDIKNNFKIQ